MNKERMSLSADSRHLPHSHAGPSVCSRLPPLSTRKAHLSRTFSRTWATSAVTASDTEAPEAAVRPNMSCTAAWGAGRAPGDGGGVSDLFYTETPGVGAGGEGIGTAP